MRYTSPNYADWRSLSAIKIWEVATLMHGVDPRALCDAMVADPDDPSGTYGIPLDTSWEERMLISAVKTQDVLSVSLNVTAPDVYTEINRFSLIPWLRIHGYLDLANQLDTSASLPVAPSLVSSPLSPAIANTSITKQPTPPDLTPKYGIANSGPMFAMTKAAMLTQHKHEWPTIESDMKSASTNGLAAARAGKRDWHEAYALEWARAKGKLAKAPQSTSALSTAMRSLSSLPSTVHTLDD